MAYERILVALDLSGEAEEVLAGARQVAGLQVNAELHIIHVIKPLRYTYGGLDISAVAAFADLDKLLRDSATGRVNAWAAEANVPSAHVHIRKGQPATEIRDCAEEIGADLIVIGTHGRHGLGLLLGSTANGVLHGVQCDVLTIRIHENTNT